MLFGFPYLLALLVQVVYSVLGVWIARVVFRQRTPAAWLVLIASITSPALTLASWFLPRFAHPLNSELYMSLTLGSAVSHMAFLAGLLFHLLRRNSESDRIVELEAIIRDRDQSGH
jgi:hypothetical protein